MTLGTTDTPGGVSDIFRHGSYHLQRRKHPEYWHLLQGLWVAAERSEIEILSSELTFLEALVLPAREKNESLMKDYEELLTDSDLILVPISTSILKEAVNLRANLNLKTPDSNHAATAVLAECDHLISNDHGLRRLTKLNVMVLSDLL